MESEYREEQFSRTELLIGEECMRRLGQARVAVFGVGGVGGYVVEALARSGVGTLDLIDSDTVSLSNLNRQIIALHSTVGRYKVDVARERVLDINPEAVVHTWRTFYLPETAEQFDFTQYDYIVDAIDTVTGKLMLAEQAKKAGTPLISAMGAGNKLYPEMFEVADISKTSVCPLAKVMRRELKKRGIEHLKVVYSKERPMTPLTPSADGQASDCGGKPAGGSAADCSGKPAGGLAADCGGKPADGSAADSSGKPAGGSAENCGGKSAGGSAGSCGRTPVRRQTPGSTAFVPSAAGLILAGEVIRDLIGRTPEAPGSKAGNG